MSISPPSDIILDVARAAEPAALETARARLQKAGGAATGEVFAAGVGGSSAVRAAGQRAAKSALPEAFVKFEAMVLQTFMQSLLPKESEAVFGSGMAGDMWKSMLAEQLGKVMAERGGIGIAERMLGDHYVEGDRRIPVGPVSGGPDKESADKQALLSAALVQELQRGVVGAIANRSADPDAAA